MVFGGFFLLDRLGAVAIGDVWEWWPLFPLGFGLVRLLSWRSAEEVASGVTWILFGFWFLVSSHAWYGLDWSTSWPLALVAIGTGMVSRALLEPLFRRRYASSAAPGGESRD
jgi:hypothetical protein